MHKIKLKSITKLIWILILQLCLNTPLHSQKDSVIAYNNSDLLISSIREKAAIINRFSGNVEILYSQKFDNMINRIESANLYFQKPYSFSWKFTKPSTYTILITNNEATTDEFGYTEKYSLNSNIDFKLANTIFSAFYNDKLFDSSNYSFSYYENELTYLIRLIPLNNSISNIYNNIELLINKTDFGLVGIRFYKVENSIVKYTFNDRIVNGLIDKDAFSFE